MCGIAGIVDGGGAVDSAVLWRMNDRHRTRGPDDRGVAVDGEVGFGHRRLSILDTSPNGHQPMTDERTGNAICHNGEIYNFRQIRSELEARGHRFRSDGDTEVVLKAWAEWGSDAVARFNGMFAFAIWDRKRQELFLARDRLGIKPLYYYRDGGRFVFSSRVAALLEHPSCPRQVDPRALSLYFQLGFVPGPLSILDGVRKLPPGATLRVSLDDLQTGRSVEPSRYWSIESALAAPRCEADAAEMTERLHDRLDQAVSRRLIADVPVGVFLSGGIDSSLIAALAARHRPGLVAFTIGFDEADYSELPFARRVASKLGLDHRFEVIRPDDLLGRLDAYIDHYDEPFADPSALPTLAVSELARREVTVALGGDGGDELFGGYPIYRYLRLLQPGFRVPWRIRDALGRGIAKRGGRAAILGGAVRQRDLHGAYSYVRGIQRSRPLPMDDDLVFPLDRWFREAVPSFSGDAVLDASHLDLLFYLSDGILQKVDVASMAYGLEARVPILDHEVVELAFRTPTRLRTRGRAGKWLLREVLGRHLPLEWFERPKKGFSVPLAAWIRGPLRQRFESELSDSNLAGVEPLDPGRVRRLLDDHVAGRADTSRLLWAVLCYARWHRRHLQEPVRTPARAVG